MSNFLTHACHPIIITLPKSRLKIVHNMSESFLVVVSIPRSILVHRMAQKLTPDFFLQSRTTSTIGSSAWKILSYWIAPRSGPPPLDMGLHDVDHSIACKTCWQLSDHALAYTPRRLLLWTMPLILWTDRSVHIHRAAIGLDFGPALG